MNSNPYIHTPVPLISYTKQSIPNSEFPADPGLGYLKVGRNLHDLRFLRLVWGLAFGIVWGLGNFGDLGVLKL